MTFCSWVRPPEVNILIFSCFVPETCFKQSILFALFAFLANLSFSARGGAARSAFLRRGRRQDFAISRLASFGVPRQDHGRNVQHCQQRFFFRFSEPADRPSHHLLPRVGDKSLVRCRSLPQPSRSVKVTKRETKVTTSSFRCSSRVQHYNRR